MASKRRSLFLTISVFILILWYLSKTKSEQLRIEQETLNRLKSDSEVALNNKISYIQDMENEHDSRVSSLERERRILQKKVHQLRRPPPGSDLQTQLSHQFPYDVKKFPTFIWQTWKYSPSDTRFSEKYKSTMNSWLEKNPEFIHEVLNDRVSHTMVKYLYMHVPDVIEAYESLPHPIYKADFFRYLILYARGGVYSDIDTIALKPIAQWIPPEISTSSVGLVVGIEADPDRPDWNDWYARRIQFCQWTIQSKPGHPVLRDIIVSITETALSRKAKGKSVTLNGKKVSESTDLMNWTGPGAWTDAIFQYLNEYVRSEFQDSVDWRNFTKLEKPKLVSDVLVLPITSFSPGVNQMGSKGFDDPQAFVQHAFSGTWKKEIA